jgi:hypothetical protein
MKRLYTIVSPSHRGMYDEWFRPSLRDDYRIEARFINQVGAAKDHHCGTAAFNRTMVEKARLMLEAIEQNMGDVFIYSDVDIQFFGPTEAAIDEAIDGYDVACQLDAPLHMGREAHPDFSGHLCAGFLVCRASDRTRSLWRDILGYVESRPRRHDQHALNELLNGLTGKPRDNPYGVRWRYLPEQFFGPGPHLASTWEPGQPLATPFAPLMHHANWTIGVANKLAQLRVVKEQVRAAA